MASFAYEAINSRGTTVKGSIEADNIDKAQATPKLMKEAMTTVSFDGLTGTGMKWGADGAVNKEPKAMVIKNGAYTAMD